MYIMKKQKKSQSIQATDLRKHLFEVLEQIQDPSDPTRVITKDGEPKAMLVSVEDWASWQETLEVMSDAALMKGIREGLKDIQKNRLVSYEEVFGHPQPSSRKR